MKLKRPLYGGEKGGDVLAVQRALNKWAVPNVALKITSEYDRRTSDRMMAFQAAEGISPASGWMGQRSLDKLWEYMDAYSRLRYRMYPASNPFDIGPVTAGDKSLLDYDLTHDTSGIPFFPATDLAWGAGVEMLAVEDCVVDTRDTSSNPGNAVYMTGKSKLRYWYGHMDRDHPLGTKIRKGRLVGRTVAQSDPKKNHGHVGVNAEFYLGTGRQLKYGKTGRGPDYTHGSPTIREQLEQALL